MSDYVNSYSADLQRAILDLLERLPLEAQPHAILDVKCRDGRVLKGVYQAIRDRSDRGHRLGELPIALFAIDDNLRALEEAAQTLAGIRHQAILADFRQPQAMRQTLEQYGVPPGAVLWEIQPFVHRLTSLENSPPADEWLSILAGDPSLAIAASLQKHFRLVAENLYRSRLLILEAHAEVPPDGDLLPLGTAHTVTADLFFSLAASQGLFNDASVKRYPQAPEPCQVTLQSMIKRDYIVRPATQNDLARLWELEELCWKHTRTQKDVLLERLQRHPQGQFVLEKKGEVLGAIYSQRIAEVDALSRCNAGDVHQLHRASGPIVQLLAVNIHPQAQNLGYGDQLLEFMLQRCSLMEGVRQVVGVTLCTKFDAGGPLSFEQYIRLENGDQDPVLLFHRLHGAKVVKAMAGYRPADQANLGNGVLVSYDLDARQALSSWDAQETSSAFAAQPIATFIKTNAARLLGIDAAQLDCDRPVMEMGLDSADLLTLQQRCEEKLKRKLGVEFFFDHNSLRKAIDYLSESAGTAAEIGKVQQVAAGVQAEQEDASAIAIIGVACKLPGGIESLDQLWNVLSREECVVGRFPRARGSWPSGAEKPGIDMGGFMSDADAFDGTFFRMSPAECQRTDPQQRILLQLAWSCLEDAAIRPETLKGSNTGVFLGASNCDYGRLIQQSGAKVRAHHGVGNSLALLANRISYFFDLCGPSMAIDAACASSLVALHSAMQSLRSGECSLALSGGVHLICHPDLSLAYHEAGMLAADGRCKVFAETADGYVRSEGAALLLLKPYEKALTEGDQIYAVLKGSAVNHGGLAGGLTVPNPQKQADLLLSAWQDAKISPRNVSYLEAHGTGTPLGDPIELEGMRKAFSQCDDLEIGAACAIGSVKSNLGHLEPAAGIAGLLKVVAAMRHGRLPATLHVNKLNSRISAEDSHLRILTQGMEWGGERPYIAGVSSFGSGGSNAHVVVQEHAPAGAMAPNRFAVGVKPDTFLFVLSAADRERLSEYVQRVIDWLNGSPEAIPLHDAVYSWQVGRTAMSHRLAMIFRDAGDLRSRLAEWLNSQQNAADVWSGKVDANTALSDQLWRSEAGRQLIDRALSERNLAQLGILWTSGADVEWHRLYQQAHIPRPRRISVPTYPFARQRYWIQQAPEAAVLQSEQATVARMVAAPKWEDKSLSAHPVISVGTSRSEYAQHHVVLCDLGSSYLPELQQAFADAHCFVLNTAPAATIADRYTSHALACFARIQEIFAEKSRGRILMQVVAPASGQQALFAGLSALLKSAEQENPQFFGQVILVPPDVGAENLLSLLKQEKVYGADSRVSYDEAVRRVHAWHEIPAQLPTSSRPLRSDGVYLITGGTGGLGHVFAEEILSHSGQTRVILTGRSPITPKIQRQLDMLPGAADRLSYRQLDLCDEGEVQRLLESLLQQYTRLNGILHCAGMMAENLIPCKSSAQFSEVLAPKVKGTINLDQASQNIELDFFVLFASVAGVVGNQGAADYASANSFMDHFADYRDREVRLGKKHGLTRSIDWPWWQSGGMVLDPSKRERLRQSTGMLPMQTATGIDAFYLSLSAPHSQIMVVEGLEPQITNYYLQRPSKIPAAPAAQPAPARETTHHSVEAQISKVELERQIKVILAEVLLIDASAVDESQAFSEYGLDSFLGAEFISRVNLHFASALSQTELFDYPTVKELATLLGKGSRDHDTAAVAAAEPQLPNSPGEDRRIAIVGMSGRYPMAADLRQYWKNLVEGRDCVVEVPSSRWDFRRYYRGDSGQKGHTSSKWLGALDDFDCFDPVFFRISPQEADFIDPQHRIFLEGSYKALEDAGYMGESLSRHKCGVYLGISGNEYGQLLAKSSMLENAPVTSNHTAIAAARIAYYLNLKGPAISVDTACSSSGVAIHLAVQALLSGDADMALAGGVCLWMNPDAYIAISHAGMFSPTGRCRTFDDSADGMVNAEGVGVLVLKRLRDAEASGDSIYGVIVGSGINQDGSTNGIMAPSVHSQIHLAREVYEKCKIDPETISYIEAHGTGTRLGDPIELEALATVFKESTAKKGYCALGSVKSNIGHTSAAAGVAGVQKVLLSMQHRTLVPSLHVTKTTTRFDFENSPFYVSRETKTWEAAPGSPRRAAISSFGFSGTNAHLVVEEYSPAAMQAYAPSAKTLVLLSARKPLQLEQKARDLLDHLRDRGAAVDLGSLGYTLQVGRAALEERLALIVSSMDELAQGLEAYLAGNPEAKNIYRGKIKRSRDAAAHNNATLPSSLDHASDLDLASLAALWTSGLEVEWDRLYKEGKPHRISLPTYPFAKEHHWFSDSKAAAMAQQDAAENPASLLERTEQAMVSKLPRSLPTACGEYWKKLDDLLAGVLLSQLVSIGFFGSPDVPVQQSKAAVGFAGSYDRWLHETFLTLAEREWVKYDGVSCKLVEPAIADPEVAWEQWNREKNHWLHDPDLQAQGRLIEATLRALPAILTGKRPATEIIFPGSSMEMVEEVYKNNALSSFYNQILADTLVTYMEARQRENPHARVRILEVGAGTGGTSALVLSSLKPYEDLVEEYCYSDISKAFLLFGEEKYGAFSPSLRYCLFNIEASPTGQGLASQSYDVVIATNVVHATRSVRTSLQNVKATLKRDGLLLLNELSEHSMFHHLTFGLLEGWWLFEEPSLRLRGGPVLSPQTWSALLEDEGFRQVFFPAKSAHHLGQQVIAAVSDGVVPLQQAEPLLPVRASTGALPLAKVSAPRQVDTGALTDRVNAFLVQAVSQMMKLKTEDIDLDVELSHLGFDSITLAGFSKYLNEALQWN